MSNDVQSHEEVAERMSGGERRGSVRHAARSLGSVTARIIGGSAVELVNFSSRGVLFECDSRLLIGARASVRITTTDANLIVTGRVVRSRVKGLINGALRYDAALVLDTELALTPAIPAAAPAATDDLVAFESDLDDPSPVEAYLAESEASLLEVARGADLPLHASFVEAAALTTVEPPPAEATPLAAETAAVVVADDAEIAFEPSVEFAFDEDALDEGGAADVLAVERVVVDEPAGPSMFDATYIPPTYDAEASPESQFEVTPPMSALDRPASSPFDARPSEIYGDAADAPAEDTAPVEVAADGIDFESEIAFEAEDVAMFEASFEDAPAEPLAEPPAEPLAELPAEPLAELLAVPLALAPADALATPAASAVEADAIEVSSDDDIEPPAAVPDTDDRVLLQFAATVPHDLAELRRIAADNQW